MTTTPTKTDLNLIDDEEEIMVNIFLKNNGIHRCKISEAWEWRRQNPDKVEPRHIRNHRRKMYEDSEND